MTEQKDTDDTNVVPIKKGNKPAPDKLTGKQTQCLTSAPMEQISGIA